MRKYINFALRGNMAVHMYDPTLKLVQAVNNPNLDKVLPAVLGISPLATPTPTVSVPEQEQQEKEREAAAAVQREREEREEREEMEEETDDFVSSPISR